jgi:hypothetical protein
VLNKAIFRDVAFATIATWTLVRIIAGRHNKVLSANECEKGFDFIHSENLLWQNNLGDWQSLDFLYPLGNGLNGQEKHHFMK